VYFPSDTRLEALICSPWSQNGGASKWNCARNSVGLRGSFYCGRGYYNDAEIRPRIAKSLIKRVTCSLRVWHTECVWVASSVGLSSFLVLSGVAKFALIKRVIEWMVQRPRSLGSWTGVSFLDRRSSPCNVGYIYISSSYGNCLFNCSLILVTENVFVSGQNQAFKRTQGSRRGLSVGN
jgi:hypothetical protein